MVGGHLDDSFDLIKNELMPSIPEALPRAVGALKAFFEKHGLLQKDCARAVGVSETAIHSWLTRASCPRQIHQRAIEIWTNGEVPASWWLTDHERAEIAEIKPFQPAVTPLPGPPTNNPPRPARKPRRGHVAA